MIKLMSAMYPQLRPTTFSLIVTKLLLRSVLKELYLFIRMGLSSMVRTYQSILVRNLSILLLMSNTRITSLVCSGNQSLSRLLLEDLVMFGSISTSISVSLNISSVLRQLKINQNLNYEQIHYFIIN
jgi:hypothetical protein